MLGNGAILVINAGVAIALSEESKTATILGGGLGCIAGSFGAAVTETLIDEGMQPPAYSSTSEYRIIVDKPEYPALENVVFKTSPPQAALG